MGLHTSIVYLYVLVTDHFLYIVSKHTCKLDASNFPATVSSNLVTMDLSFLLCSSGMHVCMCLYMWICVCALYICIILLMTYI